MVKPFLGKRSLEGPGKATKQHGSHQVFNKSIPNALLYGQFVRYLTTELLTGRSVVWLSPRGGCFQPQISPCGICGGQTDHGRGFSHSTSVFSCQYNSSNAPYTCLLNLLMPGHVMHQQFNIQELYALPTLYLSVLYLSQNKQRLVPLTA